MRSRLVRQLDRLRTGFWAIPAGCVVVALALALGVVEVDRALDDGLGRYTYGAGPDGAREVLSAITSSMITFTGLVFSITIVVLQLTSSQFSPRVLRTFLRDRHTQLALGVFVATFVYAVMVLRTVNSTEDSRFVPALATTVGVGLLLLSVGVFVGYIHHVATAIQVSSIIRSIAGETREAITRNFPPEEPRGLADLPEVLPPSRDVASTRHGVVSSLDVAGLLGLAERSSVLLEVLVRPGDFVPRGGPVVRVYGESDGLDDDALREAVVVGKDRTMVQDVAFGLRQLVDVAERALSPGVNDPTTAVQALDELHDLLRQLSTMPFPDGGHHDGHGVLRVLTPPQRFADVLSLSLDEIEQYGEDTLQVQQRIDVLLADLLTAARPDHREAVRARQRRRGPL